MEPFEEFLNDLRIRLSEDLLQYVEIFWLGKEYFPKLDDDERRRMIGRAVLHLVVNDGARVGECVMNPVDQLLVVAPWPEHGDELAARLQETMKQLPNPSLSDGFWIEAAT